MYFVSHSQYFHKTENKWKKNSNINRSLAVMVRLLQITQNLVISRCCFAEDGKEMYKDL